MLDKKFEDPEYKKNREAFVRDKEMLLRNHNNEYVAYGGGQLLEHAKGNFELMEKLGKIAEKKRMPSAIYLTRVTEKAFEKEDVLAFKVDKLISELNALAR